MMKGLQENCICNTWMILSHALERFDGLWPSKFSNVFLSVWKIFLSHESVFVVLVNLEGDDLPWEFILSLCVILALNYILEIAQVH